MPTSCVLSLSIFLASLSAAQAPSSTRYSELGLPSSVSRARLQGLLQGFVDRAYLKGFRHLGDERDFDHGHFLYGADPERPVAILYHTQELAHLEKRGGEFGYLDFDSRNWIQWIGRGEVENARRYLRSEYPRGGSWDWFVQRKLPDYAARGTIVDKMLDPALGLTQGRQWEFSRVPCAGLERDPDAAAIRVELPAGRAVCLWLGAS